MAIVTNNSTLIPLAGIATTATGKFAPLSDGTSALIQAMTLVDQAGAAVTIGSGQTVQGMAADGAAVTGNPVLTAGFDGTNAQTILTDTSGRVISVGAGASGATSVGNPVGVGGVYNSTLPTLTNGQRGDIQINAKGGLVAALYDAGGSGIAASGNSSDALAAANSLYVQGFGRIYNGSTWDRARTAQGAALVGTGIGVQAVEEAGRTFSNIATATTTVVKSGAGHFHTLNINTYVASATITIYDNTAGSGTKIATITLGSVITGDQPTTLTYDLAFATGLTLVTSGATDITVTYR